MENNTFKEEVVVDGDFVELPSAGLLYPNKKDKLFVTYMTARDEDLLTSENLIRTGKVFERLIERKVKDKDISVQDLLNGDILAIMLWLRISAYGTEYPVTVTCPQTFKTFEEIVDLSLLEYKYLDVTPDSNFEFSFTLPKSNKTVTFKFLSYKETNDLEKQIEMRQKKLNMDFTEGVTARLKAMVRSVDGDRNPLNISRFIDKMSPLDSLKLRNYIYSIEPGINFNYYFVSPYTGERFQGKVSFTSRFFYPES